MGLRLVGGTEKRESMIQYLCTYGMSAIGTELDSDLAEYIIRLLDSCEDNFFRFATLTRYLPEHVAQEFLMRFDYLPLERRRKVRG